MSNDRIVHYPKVAVLLATYNGSEYVLEQIESILNQNYCEVTIFISDDLSTDNTLNVVASIDSSRIVLLPSHDKFGNANKNFIRLVRDVDVTSFDYVAFSDQDDIWLHDKLEAAITYIREMNLDVYSSDVIAFWPSGNTRLIRKSKPMRRFDYMFESAGPGCTFVFKGSRFITIKDFISNNNAVDGLRVHDWLLYAYARYNNWRWYIDNQPRLRYRQHASNEVGANVGVKGALRRLGRIHSESYIVDSINICNAIGIKNEIYELLTSQSSFSFFKLSFYSRSLRRDYFESFFLKLCFFYLSIKRLF